MALRRINTSGDSMCPTLRSGDLVLCHTNLNGLRPGMIVVSSIVVHRLVWIDPFGGFWECGDAPMCLPVRRRLTEIEGRVVAAVRDGQWLDISEKVPWRSRRKVMWTIARKVVGRVWNHRSL